MKICYYDKIFYKRDSVISITIFQKQRLSLTSDRYDKINPSRTNDYYICTCRNVHFVHWDSLFQKSMNSINRSLSTLAIHYYKIVLHIVPLHFHNITNQSDPFSYRSKMQFLFTPSFDCIPVEYSTQTTHVET